MRGAREGGHHRPGRILVFLFLPALFQIDSPVERILFHVRQEGHQPTQALFGRRKFVQGRRRTVLMNVVKLCMVKLVCLRLLWHCIRAAASRTRQVAGTNRAIRMAMMAMTTSISMRVKPGLVRRICRMVSLLENMD